MNRQRSKIQVFFLLIFYCVFLFLFLAFLGVLIGVSIHYLKSGVWDFTKVEAPRLILGAIAYAIPAGIGIWALSRLKERKECLAKK